MVPLRSRWGKDHILPESAFTDHERHEGHEKLGHFSLIASTEACQIVLPTIILPALQEALGRMMVGRMIHTSYRGEQYCSIADTDSVDSEGTGGPGD